MKECTAQKHNTIWSSSAGFSLVELIIVMGLFLVVIMISTSAFDSILSGAKQQMASSESNIQGIVGLEMMRWDIENAGYGLPWQLGFSATFEESTQAADSLADGIDPTDFNDNNLPVAAGDPNNVPRAIQSGTASGAGEWENGRDYIVIKSAAVGTDAAAKKWAYLEGVDPNSFIKESGSDDLLEKDRVITLDARTRRLIAASTAAFSYAVPARTSGKFVPPVEYQPKQDTDVYLVYGIEAWNDTTSTLRVPYNRVDYYIRRPAENNDISARCAPGTGILYKGNLNHSDGKVSQYPLYDCVADMQVVYALDTNGDGAVDFHGDQDALQAMSAKTIRSQLKEIRVYILTHEGQKDRLYKYTSGSNIQVGETGQGRVYDVSKLQNIGGSWENYRWKTYTIVVTPNNL
ncbi:MAG: hypothetical protein CVU66_02700 [Deltaproteobacteria bacterium HGW-Deltaproteobacteria-23]|nr:MAG: hypothetical protein CVU66_02700 [Deltaproteobacteria bacterium HGW-Deltaproteobacteria-23]